MYKNYAKEYYTNGIVQQDAALELCDLLPYKPQNVLDVGCGSGRVSEIFYSRMNPIQMIAIDKSSEMIKEAKKNKDSHVIYKHKNIENLDLSVNFDVIVSNSSIQWFSNINKSLLVIKSLLSDNGSFYVQSSFKKNWCPSITVMIDDFFRDEFPELKPSFTFPCMHLENLVDYSELLSNNGFIINNLYSKDFKYCVDRDGFFKIFKSGAIKAYSNQSNFSVPLPDGYYDKLIKYAYNYYEHSDSINLVMPRVFIEAKKSKLNSL
ncbi:hypothetical protein VII00023_20672 [Vibrio ichthyoenteri ATCC 700023]|uniref:Methyltransferase domain-containing protein n=1 Tax=Vibrio ichthyoenteri ATCC 700023 TaxID=870968 RepID=F9S7U7_9VIBR|nr:methyltransferase domain-containing protein [Vibrio ichthyoenteri]EGU30997.1 hypothetical protein VII00023_20672 [Vibrio ichthyoenteri ATCC 700023]